MFSNFSDLFFFAARLDMQVAQTLTFHPDNSWALCCRMFLFSRLGPGLLIIYLLRKFRWEPASDSSFLVSFFKLLPGECGLDSSELVYLLDFDRLHLVLLLIVNRLSVHHPLKTTLWTAFKLAGETGLVSNDSSSLLLKCVQHGRTSCGGHVWVGWYLTQQTTCDLDLQGVRQTHPKCVHSHAGVGALVPQAKRSQSQTWRGLIKLHSISESETLLLKWNPNNQVPPFPDKVWCSWVARVTQEAGEDDIQVLLCLSFKLQVRSPRWVCV